MDNVKSGRAIERNRLAKHLPGVTTDYSIYQYFLSTRFILISRHFLWIIENIDFVLCFVEKG